MSRLSLIVRTLTVVGILAGGLGGTAALIAMRKAPAKKARDDKGAPVETLKLESRPATVRIRAQGTVMPARQVIVSPEVSGRITWMASEAVPGGRFDQGESILRIDAADYGLAVKQQLANAEQAEVNLKLEQSRAEIAKSEWKIIGEDVNATDQGRKLALRKPQLQAAKVAVKSAKSATARARLALSKTSIRAPFNAFVREKTGDVGQLVSPGANVLTIVGTDHFWVQVTVPMDKLAWIDVPGVNTQGEGSPVVVRQEVGGAVIKRQGRVIRLQGDLDPVGRMARVIVEVDDPLGLKQPAEPAPKKAPEGTLPESGLPLLLGAYVNVEILSRREAPAIEIPRVAVHGGNKVHVFADGKLAVREVDVLWRREDAVLVSAGVKSGDQVIVTKLPAATAGMKLRQVKKQEKTVLGKR